MASVIVAATASLFEIDEVEASKFGDEVYYTFLTTGVLPSLAQIKTKIWAYLAPPVKRLEVLAIEEVERGPIAKRYKIYVKGKTFTKTLGDKRYRLLPLKGLGKIRKTKKTKGKRKKKR